MANYISLTEMFASTNSLTTLFDWVSDPSGYDDGSYEDAVSFVWNNINFEKIVANGNSWIGLNTTQQDTRSLLVSNSDKKMYALYKETGKVGGYDFIRYRWRGVTSYIYSYNDHVIIYDFAFVDNGRLYINIDRWDDPSDLNSISIKEDSVYLDTLFNLVVGGQYTAYCETPNNFSTIKLKVGLDELTTFKYLVKNKLDDNFYTYQNGSWNQVSASVSLASTFTTYGMDTFPSTLPPEFEVWKWQDEGTVGSSIEIIADPVSTDADNSVVFHITLDDATTIQNIVANSDGLVEYSNDGTIWEHAISDISDPTDFYVRVVLLTYFTNLTVLYE